MDILAEKTERRKGRDSSTMGLRMELPDLSILLLAWLPAFATLPLFIPFKYILTTAFLLTPSLYLYLVKNGDKDYAPNGAKTSDQYKQELKSKYSAVYDFEDDPERARTVFNSFLIGITFPSLLRIIVEYWQYIDWQRYWNRILGLFAMSTVNSIIGFVEVLMYERKVQHQALNEVPVFILGHPRSGTTRLHEVLTKDKAMFHSPTTFQCMFSNTCIVLYKPLKFLLGKYTERKKEEGRKAGMTEAELAEIEVALARPMDNVKVSMDSPQEDELALTVLSSGSSPYMPLMFMSCEPSFRQYFSFDYESVHVPAELKADQSVFQHKFEQWKRAFFYFIKKVTFMNDPEGKKHLLLKSPVHTARGKLFVDMFPKAKFIYLHRDPYRTFRSAANMAEKSYSLFYFSRHEKEQVQDFIIEQYKILFKEYVAAKEVIPEQNLIELSFDELTGDLVGSLRKVYDKFGLSGFEEMKPTYEDCAEQNKQFQKNSFVDLSSDLKKVVYEHWKEAFEYFGYAK